MVGEGEEEEVIGSTGGVLIEEVASHDRKRCSLVSTRTVRASVVGCAMSLTHQQLHADWYFGFDSAHTQCSLLFPSRTSCTATQGRSGPTG